MGVILASWHPQMAYGVLRVNLGVILVNGGILTVSIVLRVNMGVVLTACGILASEDGPQGPEG